MNPKITQSLFAVEPPAKGESPIKKDSKDDLFPIKTNPTKNQKRNFPKPTPNPKNHLDTTQKTN
jgi:hypothetical protein